MCVCERECECVCVCERVESMSCVLVMHLVGTRKILHSNGRRHSVLMHMVFVSL